MPGVGGCGQETRTRAINPITSPHNVQLKMTSTVSISNLLLRARLEATISAFMAYPALHWMNLEGVQSPCQFHTGRPEIKRSPLDALADCKLDVTPNHAKGSASTEFSGQSITA